MKKALALVAIILSAIFLILSVDARTGADRQVDRLVVIVGGYDFGQSHTTQNSHGPIFHDTK